MTTDAEKLAQISQELAPYLPMIAQASDTILDEDVSNYPIFVVSQLDIDLGIPLLERQEEGFRWSIHASTLEEMSAKKVIQEERIQDFRKVFKDPRHFLCLFLLSDLGARFVFVLRKENHQA